MPLPHPGRTVAPLLCAAILAFGPAASPLHAEPADTGATHTVQDGETLWQIADAAGVSSDALLLANNLSDADLIYTGQVLTIPASSGSTVPVPAPAPAPAAQTYTIASGDTLWSIAQQFGISSDALLAANSSLSSPDSLVTGAQLAIPAGGVAAQVAAAAPPPTPTPAPAPPASVATPVAAPAPSGGAGTFTIPYIIQPGQTLYGIASQFSVSVADIAQASGLADPNTIAVGAVLRIPVPTRQHVVQAGETLYSIAASEKIDMGSLVDFNTIADPSLIQVGQVLQIPAAPLPASAPAQTTSTPAPPASTATPSPSPTATPSPTPSPTPSTPAPTPTASPSPSSAPATRAATSTPTPTPQPKKPLVVATVPPGAPTDGLAGASLKYLGTPYVWGGSSPSGFDCSGFVWYVAKQVGKPISRGLFAQYNAGSHPDKGSLQPGDLVFFQDTYTAGLSHNGIYIGNGLFAHAGDEASGVTVSSLSTAYWTAHWFGATRLP